MDVDSTFEIVGEFGPYQKRIYFLLCLMPFMTSFHTLLSSFILATPDHRSVVFNVFKKTSTKVKSFIFRLLYNILCKDFYAL